MVNLKDDLVQISLPSLKLHQQKQHAKRVFQLEFAPIVVEEV